MLGSANSLFNAPNSNVDEAEEILPLIAKPAAVKLPNLPAIAVPENTDELSVALVRATKEPSVSSIPKKPILAPPELYLNLIPLSRLSSELSEPISNTGSAIFKWTK